MSTGRGCDGYEDVDSKKGKTGLKTISKVSPVAAVPFTWQLLPGDDAERQHFHFFQSVTTSDLAGFFDFGFWSCGTLQVSHLYPALWHAITAVACVHRCFISRSAPLSSSQDGENPQLLEFALKQFNKAIKSLSLLMSGRDLGQLDKLVVLTTCILFTCLCSMEGRQTHAFMHINNGLKLLHQWNTKQGGLRGPQSDLTVDMLVLMFSRLDTQVRPYIAGQEVVLQWTEDQIFVSSAKASFKTLLNAYVDLEMLFNGLMQLFLSAYCRVPDPKFLEQREEYIQDFADWDTRLVTYLGTVPCNADSNALRILSLRRMFAEALLAMDMTKGELAHDDVLSVFAKTLDIVEEMLPTPVQHTEDGVKGSAFPRPPTFSLATMVVEPLYWIGVRCREPIIRRRALRLLQLNPRREGICEGMTAVKIVEQVIEMEETGCPQSGRSSPNHTTIGTCTTGRWICDNHRVAVCQFLLVTERQLRLQMWTVKDMALSRPGTEMLCSWW